MSGTLALYRDRVCVSHRKIMGVKIMQFWGTLSLIVHIRSIDGKMPERGAIRADSERLADKTKCEGKDQLKRIFHERIGAWLLGITGPCGCRAQAA